MIWNGPFARPWLIDAKQIVDPEVFTDDEDQMLDWCRRGRLPLERRAPAWLAIRPAPANTASGVEACEILRDEIAANHLLIGVDQPFGDRTWHPARAKSSAV